VTSGLVARSVAEDTNSWRVDDAKTREDSRISALVRQLDESRMRALERARARVGLVPGRLPIAWRVVVSREPPADSGVFHAAETVVEGTRVVVSIPANRYLAAPRKVHVVVVHEATHALLASRLGSAERYARVPPWFREGLALLVSEEGPVRVEDRVAVTVVSGKKPTSFLRGVTHQPLPAESFLAVSWIEKRVGAPAFRALVLRVAAGFELQSELTEFLGLEPDVFRRGVLEASEKSVHRLLPGKIVADYHAAIELHREGDRDSARRRLGELASFRNRHALRATCRYLHTRLLVDEGRAREALAVFRASLLGDREILWEPEILEQLGNCELALDRPKRAGRYWNEVLERFPEDRDVGGRVRAKLRGS
jgi:hypothetical protein